MQPSPQVPHQFRALLVTQGLVYTLAAALATSVSHHSPRAGEPHNGPALQFKVQSNHSSGIGNDGRMCGSLPSAGGVLGCSGSGVFKGDCTAFSGPTRGASFCAFPLESPPKTVAVEAALDGPAASHALQLLIVCLWSGAVIDLKQHALYPMLRPSAQVGLDS